MKPETQEWIAKAEGDWRVATREMQASDPVWDVVCFRAQQCAEKYLKAFLEERDIPFLRTHDLVVLLNASRGQLPWLDALKPQLAQLSVFGIASRYPGAQADRQAAAEAMRTAEATRQAV